MIRGSRQRSRAAAQGQCGRHPSIDTIGGYLARQRGVWGFAFSSHTCPVVVLLGGAIFFSIWLGLVSRGPPSLRSSAAVCRAAIAVSDRCAGCHGCTEDRAPTTQPHASTPATRRPVLGCPYWKYIPSCLSVRQITLQVRVVCPGKPKRNVDGISKVAATTRQAPDSVKLRTVHGSTAFFPRIIVPDLSARRRGVFRRSAIARK